MSAVGSCAGQPARGIGSTGESGGAGGSGSAAPSAGLDVPFERLDGRRANLLDYAGDPTLVVLFATFDAPSQVLFEAVVRVERRLRARGLRVVGVAIQPRARDLVLAFRDFLHVPFDLGTASPELLAGDTALGAVRAVPALLWLDRRGRLVRARAGIVDEATLERWCSEILPR